MMTKNCVAEPKKTNVYRLIQDGVKDKPRSRYKPILVHKQRASKGIWLINHHDKPVYKLYHCDLKLISHRDVWLGIFPSHFR